MTTARSPRRRNKGTKSITITVDTVDGLRKRMTFKNLKDARYFARRYVGKHPDLGQGYAVSSYGDSRVTVAGASLFDIFPSMRERPLTFEEMYFRETGRRTSFTPAEVREIQDLIRYIDASAKIGEDTYFPSDMTFSQLVRHVRQNLKGSKKKYRKSMKSYAKELSRPGFIPF